MGLVILGRILDSPALQVQLDKESLNLLVRMPFPIAIHA